MAPWTSAAVSTTASTGFLQVRQLEFLKFLLNNWNSYTEFKSRSETLIEICTFRLCRLLPVMNFITISK